MSACQALFDQGHITYHRTDYPNLSDEGIQKIKQYLSANGIPHAETVVVFKTKADAQEAHEAIRPTDVAVEIAGQSDTEKRVYQLIRERAILSVMPSGVDATTEFIFVSERKVQSLAGAVIAPTYHSKGKAITEPGWRTYAKVEPVNMKDVTLPNLSKGDLFDGSVSATEEFTKPPSRFTEHTLIKALESAGIGRPSTYHAIMENIKGRRYVIPDPSGKDKSPVFRSGEHGEYVVDALKEMAFMDRKYTRAIESSLDKIAKGSMGYINLIKPVLKQVNDDVQFRLHGDTLALTSDCPGCGQPVIQKSSRKRSGSFWVHRDQSHATDCITYIDDADNSPRMPPPVIKDQCPNCQASVVRRLNKHNNPYWMHENKDASEPCGHTFLNDSDGVPELQPILEESPCPACKQTVQRRYSEKTHRHFWTHKAKRSKCSHTFLDDEDGQPALQS
jgi:DNA topoisomerase-1